jgi:hypothetical protein
MKLKLWVPFVVSLSSLAAMLACSSSSDTESSSGGTSGGTSGSNGTSGVTAPPSANGCPATKPGGDTPCPENGLKCDYGTPAFGCPDPLSQGHVECQSGLWNAPSSEPECAYPGPGCPGAAKDAKGSACPSGAGVCLYPDCSGVVDLSYACVDGKLDGPNAPNCGGGDAGGG